jgi:hypothetical protein
LGKVEKARRDNIMPGLGRLSKNWLSKGRRFGDKMLSKNLSKWGIIGGGAGLFVASRYSNNGFIRGAGDIAGLGAVGLAGYAGARSAKLTNGSTKWRNGKLGSDGFWSGIGKKLRNFEKAGGMDPKGAGTAGGPRVKAARKAAMSASDFRYAGGGLSPYISPAEGLFRGGNWTMKDGPMTGPTRRARSQTGQAALSGPSAPLQLTFQNGPGAIRGDGFTMGPTPKASPHQSEASQHRWQGVTYQSDAVVDAMAECMELLDKGFLNGYT